MVISKRKLFWVIFIILSLLIYIGLMSYDFGRKAFASKHYEAARIFYKVAAYCGNGAAQNNLGSLYAEGLGGEVNYEAAAQFYQRAVDNGISQAKFNLANLYEDGLGLKKDTKKALYLFESAAIDGDLMAAFNLAHILATDKEGSSKNIFGSVYWYGRAAESGFTSAQYNLGILFANEENIRDLTKAAYWYSKAAEKGHSKAMMDTGTLYIYGIGVERDFVKGIAFLRKAELDKTISEEVSIKIVKACASTTDVLELKSCM